MWHFGAVHINAMLNLTKGRVGIFCSFWGENEAHNLVHTSGSLAIQDKKHLLGWDPLILFSSARWYRAVVKRFEFISEIPPVARTPQPPPLCPEFACRAWQIGLTSQFCHLLTKWVILDKSTRFSKPQFPYLWNESKSSTFFTGVMLGGWNEITYTKHLVRAWYLARAQEIVACHYYQLLFALYLYSPQSCTTSREASL